MNKALQPLRAAVNRVVVSSSSSLNNWRDAAWNRKAVWLVGDGRSGTTWVANLIDYRKDYRSLYEPFHPLVWPSINYRNPFLYVRPDETEASVEPFARQVFSGMLRHERVDRHSFALRAYSGVLVKDIFANLLLRWVIAQFPHIKSVLLLRNPYAVAVSKLKKGIWMREPSNFLENEKLRTDYLAPFEDVVRSAETPFEKHVCIWAVIYYVALSGLDLERVRVQFYERLYLDFEQEVRDLLGFVEGRMPEGALDARLLKRFEKPSKTDWGESLRGSGKNPLHLWRNKVSDAEVEKGGAVPSVWIPFTTLTLSPA
jgi:hypothetical protein